MASLRRLPLTRPSDPYCRGLLEPPERRGWCVSCRWCREWRVENVPAAARFAPIPGEQD